MTSFTELVEAPVDWLTILPPEDRTVIEQLGPLNRLDYQEETLDRLAVMLREAETQPHGIRERFLSWLVEKLLENSATCGDACGDVSGGFLRHLGREFLNELHDLLCSDAEKYSEDRKKLLREYKAGQTTFAAGVAATIGPYVGGGAQFIVAAVVVALSIIGQVGLKSWCAMQTVRRQQGKAEERPDD